MEKVKKYLKDKSIGFYVLAAIILLAIVTLIVYGFSYGRGPREVNIDSMSWWAFIFLIIGIVGSVGLICLKQYKWAPVFSAVFSFLAFLFYIYGVYQYVSVVIVSIDLRTYSAAFIVCTTLFAVMFIGSFANIFLKQVEEK